MDLLVEKIYDFFPKSMQVQVNNVIGIISQTGSETENNHLISEERYQSIFLNSEPLMISYRVYFHEPDLAKISTLTSKERAVLFCVYTRHYDGYVREKNLLKLLNEKDYFIIPFMVLLMGEYILTILELISKHIDNNLELYRKFVSENKNLWLLTKSRIVSYWNEYYRYEYPDFQQYIGYNIISKIDSKAK